MSKSLKKLIDINRLREFKNKTGSVYVQTAAVDQTIGGTKTFSKPIVGSVTGSSGSCTGNAATATKAVSADSATNAGHATSADKATKAEQDGNGNNIVASYVAAGSEDSTTDIGAFMAARPSFIKSFTYNNVWTDAISVRHRNGGGDGYKYGTYIRSSNMTGVSNLLWNHQSSGTWQGERTLVDSANLAGFISITDSTGDNTGEAVSVNGGAAVTLKLPATIKASLDGNAATATSATTAASATTATNATNAAKLGNIASSGYVQTGKVNQTIDGTKTFSAAIVGSVTGNAGSATKLATARTINGTAFDGTANITTANWGTARNITITDGTNTSTAVSVNGSANVSLTLPATIKANLTGNCSGSSGSCTGNAASATKLAAKRTIALSGAATGAATGFDGSGNITIPVTALSGSAITSAITIYDLVPDGAEAHNAMWGGRDITAAFNAGTVSANIADGTFKDIFPGDYITKSVTISGKTYDVTWVVADCDYWINKGDGNTAMTAHHVVIVPQAPIYSYRMNGTNNTAGGYKDSWVYRSEIPACATGIVSAFGSEHILTFRDGISNSVDSSHVSSGLPQFTGTPGWWGEWVSVQCNLMSEKMVYGAPICASGAMDSTMATRQMSAFRLSERLINYNRQAWWLRDDVAASSFALVNGNGCAHSDVASNVHGVRPFALLK